jgi:hypothetical protein
MLTFHHSNVTDETRLYITIPRGKAWIAHIPRRSPEHIVDWNIWVRLDKSDVGRSAKSPLKVEVESALRSWLLRRYRRFLKTVSFSDLCRIAEAEAASGHATQKS